MCLSCTSNLTTLHTNAYVSDSESIAIVGINDVAFKMNFTSYTSTAFFVDDVLHSEKRQHIDDHNTRTGCNTPLVPYSLHFFFIPTPIVHDVIKIDLP